MSLSGTFRHFLPVFPRIKASNKHCVPAQRVVAHKNILVYTAGGIRESGKNRVAGRRTKV